MGVEWWGGGSGLFTGQFTVKTTHGYSERLDGTQRVVEVHGKYILCHAAKLHYDVLHWRKKKNTRDYLSFPQILSIPCGKLRQISIFDYYKKKFPLRKMVPKYRYNTSISFFAQIVPTPRATQFYTHIQLNFEISNTDISNTIGMFKWFVSTNHLVFSILPSVSKKLWYLEVFIQSPLVKDKVVWLFNIIMSLNIWKFTDFNCCFNIN